MKRYSILLLVLILGFSFVIDIPLEDLGYTIEKVQGFDRIIIDHATISGKPGEPEIPVVVYNYPLPPNQRIKGLKTVEERWQEVPGNFYLYPTQRSVPLKDTPVFTWPEPELYNSALPFPKTAIAGYSCGNLRGYRIGQIGIMPFRYFPKSGRLQVLRSLRLEIETKDCGPGIMPKRQTGLSRALFKRFVSSILKRTSAANPVIEPYCNIEENPEDVVPTDLPSVLGPPVDLVILTTEPLVNAYEKFSRLKRLFGFNTVIRTMTWVRQHYQGIDDAERLRNFIKSAVEEWGVSYLLLAGDVPKVPTRWVWLELGSFPMTISSDLYFSDLDGTWNYDEDERFGEVPDSIDLYPDLFVGRLTMTTEPEVLGYLNKLHTYLFPSSSPVPIQIKSLFVSSKFWIPGDSYLMAQRLSNHLPPHFIKIFRDERPIQEFKDSIHTGYGLITVLAHGDVNIIRILSNPATYATNFFYDSLTNAVYPLMVVVSCYTNPFQEDCLGEHWVNNPVGGGIGYIGPTSSSVALDHEHYVASLFATLFDKISLGQANAYSKIPFIYASQWDNWKRALQFSLSLLGDPTLTLWDTIPRYYNSVTVNTDTLNLGLDTLRFSLDPLVPFTVVLYKENETFIRDSSATGVLQVQVKTKSPGYLKYTILNKDFVPIIDSIFVRPVSPYLVYAYKTVLDTTGNNNGVVNPGEEVFLNIGIKNNGSAPASAVSAKLFSADSFITIITDLASYPEIWPGQVKENLTPFYFKVLNTIPDKHSLDFNLVINYSGTSNADTFQLTGQAPKLRLYTQRHRILADTLKVQTLIENCGQAMADSVIGRVGVYSDTVVLIDSVVNFPNLAPGAILAGLDSFRFYLNYPGTLVYNLRLYYRGLEISNQQIRLGVPLSPDSLRTVGTRHSIILEWEPVPGALGYRIYRAVNQSGPYQFLKNPLVPTTYFEDFTVHSGIDYYYYLYAVDSSMNEGLHSDTVLARKNPLVAEGWPKTVYSYLFSSPNFGDIDPAYPGYEVVVGSNEGAIYAWHYDGTPVMGDGRLFQTNNRIWSSPAIGDLNRDGTLEIVFGVDRYYTNNLYVINNQGMPLPGWPKSLNGSVLTSPVLADLDNNGDLEIIVCSDSVAGPEPQEKASFIYVFHHTGEGVYSPSGLLKRNSRDELKGTPAVGDLTGDGNLEIVSCGSSDSLFVWDRYGNYLPPFPIQVMAQMKYSVVLGDVIGDERLEIAFYSGGSNYLHLIDADGNILWQRHIPSLGDVEASPVFGNILGDSRPEIIAGNNKGFQTLLVFDSLGNIIAGFPPAFGNNYKLPIIADADNDNLMDLIVGSADWNLYAVNSNGLMASGFPLHFGVRVESSPAVFDLDGDGRLELMVGANDFKFHLFDINSTGYEWPKFRYDPYNSGVYQSGNPFGTEETRPQPTPEAPRLKIYPNPFRTSLVIEYALSTMHYPENRRKQSAACAGINTLSTTALGPSIKIYDAAGRLVKSFNPLTNYQSPIIWSGDDDLGRQLPVGVYFVQLGLGDYKKVAKAVLLR